MRTDEETIQLKVSSELKKQIKLTALKKDQTVREFVLMALSKNGIKVPTSELRDRRKSN